MKPTKAMLRAGTTALDDLADRTEGFETKVVDVRALVCWEAMVSALSLPTQGTWLAQAGVPSGQASASLGMTEAEYERTYLHNDPSFQGAAADAF